MSRWFNRDFLAETITFLLFILLFAFALYVHDPWFDEMQAWLIAKTAPWYDLFFVLPHFEGHPPFFHLLLALPARLGVPWQIGLPFFCVAATLASVYLILFKAPFARWVRLCLPFTFFIFYQYGVLSRPYNIMLLATIGAALCFPKRMEKPFPFIGCLAALCMCHLFGIALAGGIAGVWLWELRGTFLQKKWYCDKRLLGLAGLLVFAVSLVLLIKPSPQAMALDEFSWLGALERLPLLLFILPGDILITDICQTLVFPDRFDYSLTEVSLTLGLQGLFWWILFSFLPKGKKEYVLLPAMMLLSLMCVYLARHHLGIFGMVFLFAFWISYEDKTVTAAPSLLAKKLGKWMLVFSLVVPIIWTVGSVYLDMKDVSFSGQEVMAFLQEHQLDKRRIMSAWCPPGDRKCQEEPATTRSNFGAELSFYAGKNLFYNYNYGSGKLYRQLYLTTPEQREYDFAVWRAGGLPDVVFGEADLDSVFGGKNLLSNYTIVYQIEVGVFWKLRVNEPYIDNIYVRNDLLEAHHLTPIEPLLTFSFNR